MQGARFILNTRYFSIAKPGEQTSEYKLSREHVKRLVLYCGTRETVSLEVKQENRNLSVTLKQQETINELLQELQSKDGNEGKETFEYKDYLKAPTRQNASELISRLSEIILYGGNAKSIDEVENLIDYAANRPGVVRVGEHGLFSSFPNVDLEKAAEEISTHDGNVWTHILSLRREDADRFGYDSQQPWRDLVMSHIDDIAEVHEIKPENLRWYAAMHNTGHHPHIHLFVYSADPIDNEGLFNEKKNKSITKMKSAFANDIFKDDPYFTYAQEQKTEYRNELRKQSEKLINELQNGKNAGFSDDTIELLTNKMNKLAALLPAKGKQVYGFMTDDKKQLVNEIQKIFVYDNPILSQLYQNWCTEQNNIVRLYINDPKFDYPIENNKDFIKIKNDIIKAAESLRDGTSKNTDFEYVSQNNTTPKEKSAELEITGTADVSITQKSQDKMDKDAMKKAEAKKQKEIENIQWGEEYINHYYGLDRPDFPLPPKKYYSMNEMLKDYPDLICYSEDPKAYIPELHGKMDLIFKSDDEQIQKFKSLRILANNFDTRNGEICRKLADCYRYGNGCNKDVSEALMWYGIAVDEFKDSMAAYRLAELYYYGADEIEIDNNLANHYFKTAYIQFRDEIKNSQYFYALEDNSEFLDYYDKVSREDAYKEYLIGRMYMNGQGIEQNYDKAYSSFKLSATNGYSHSNYYIGNMYYYGLGFEQSFEKATEYYYRAQDNNDMYATYRLAKMHLKGEGVSVDLLKAEELLLKCSDKIILANYDLAKLYEENPTVFNVSEDIIQKYYKAALKGFLEQEQDKHDPFTEMRIGSMYLNGKGTDINLESVVNWFDKASISGNPDAAYQLAYIYSSEKYNLNDAEKSNIYYEKALKGYIKAEKSNENSNAEYRLGYMYFKALGTKQNIDEAISWFSKSMQNGNADAAYKLAQIFSTEEYGFFDKEKADIFYRYAAELGNSYANYHLGKQEFEDNNIKASIEYFEKAANGNVSHAWYTLGQIYSNEGSEFLDGIKAQECYNKALNQYISDYSNNPDDFIAYRIASMYMYGRGTEENLKEAVQWFEKSYELGSPDAAYQLGLIHSQNGTEYFDNTKAPGYFAFALKNYLSSEDERQNSSVEYRIAKMLHNGLGTDKNIDKAILWYEKSLENGNHNSAFELGKIYYINSDVSKDLLKAEEYFKISAEADNLYAYYYLGNISLEKEDTPKAIEYFEKAASGDISHAWYKLGQIYSNEASEFFDGVKAQDCYANALKQYISDYANNPDDFTAYRIANMYIHGQGTEENLKEAVQWFEKSYELGSPDAAYQLGLIHLQNGTEYFDNAKAQEYFTFAYNNYLKLEAEEQNPVIEYRIAKMLHNGHGTDINIDKAIEWYEKSLANGNNNSAFELGKIYYGNSDVPKDLFKAEKYFKISAEADNLYAYYYLGNISLEKEDIPKATEYFEKAADNNISHAWYKLGQIYSNETSEFFDGVKAQECYANALKQYISDYTERADDFTAYRIASICMYGQGTEKNLKEAVQWFEKSYELGSPDAAYQLGVIYSTNEYNLVDIQKSNKYYASALIEYEKAEKDKINAVAEYRLGKMYQYGLGTDKDIIKSISWYIKSLDNGNINAAYQLGKFYYSGNCIPKDMMKAEEYFKISAEADNLYAYYYLGNISLEKEDTPKAIEYFEKAASGDISHAWYKLGQIYSNEELGAFDGTKAQECYNKALNQYISDYSNNPDDFTAYRIASMYMHGQGTSINVYQAISWFEKSYNFSNPDAAYQLGNIYHSDKYGFKNNNLSQQYYNFAFNSYMAEFNKNPTDGHLAMRIGTMHHYGFGVERDIEKALSWYRKAVELGNMKAQQKIDNAQNDKSLSALSIASTACHLGRIINTETQAAAKQHYTSDHKIKRIEKLNKIAAGHAISDNEQGYDY